jgi:hypothetical protein
MLKILARHCGSTALAFSMHTHQVAIPAWRWRYQKVAAAQSLLKRVALERIVLVTSDGSDWIAGSGKAEKIDGGYRVTARKSFASGAPAGDLFVTSAVIARDEGAPTIIHFAVPMDSPHRHRTGQAKAARSPVNSNRRPHGYGVDRRAARSSIDARRRPPQRSFRRLGQPGYDWSTPRRETCNRNRRLRVATRGWCRVLSRQRSRTEISRYPGRSLSPSAIWIAGSIFGCDGAWATSGQYLLMDRPVAQAGPPNIAG